MVVPKVAHERGAHPLPASQSEVLVGRRYLERGFLDAAMKLFVRNTDWVTPDDWSRLADRLMARGRVLEVVRICELGDVPLPRDRMLAIGDASLGRRDFDGAIRFYELADAGRERWSRVVDELTALPEREYQARVIAERHLGANAAQPEGRRHIRVVG